MPKAWLIGGAAFVIILLAASIVVALTQQEQPLPAGTPERTVQLFMTALHDDDLKLAYSYFAEDLREDCRLEDMAASRRWAKGLMEDSRVAHQETQDLGGSAIVTARVSRIRGSGLFGTSESTHDERFTLTREVGEWRFSRNPWPYLGCRPVEVKPVAPGVRADPRPEETPERTVTRHVTAAENDDLKLLHSLWSRHLRAGCPLDSLAAAVPDRDIGIADAKLVVKEVKYGQNAATVIAEITVLASGAGGDRAAPSVRQFVLAWEEERWVFAEYPWPFADCAAPNIAPEATSAQLAGPGTQGT